MISPEVVRHIAGLSRIYLQDSEISRLTQDLEKVLHYVEKLEKLNVARIDPTSHIVPLKNVFREDRVKPSLSQEQALSFAVEKHKGAFKVPKVI